MRHTRLPPAALEVFHASKCTVTGVGSALVRFSHVPVVQIYELLVNCIPADTIMRKLLSCLLEPGRIPLSPAGEQAKHELAHWAAAYEHRMQLGQKEVFHIEAFCARAMQVIKVAAAGGSGMAPATGR